MMDFERTAVPNLQKLLRAQDRAKFADPLHDPSLPTILMAYTRASSAEPWSHVAIVRTTRKLTVAIFRKVRRDLRLDATRELLLVPTANRDPAARPRRQWKLGL